MDKDARIYQIPFLSTIITASYFLDRAHNKRARLLENYYRISKILILLLSESLSALARQCEELGLTIPSRQRREIQKDEISRVHGCRCHLEPRRTICFANNPPTPTPGFLCHCLVAHIQPPSTRSIINMYHPDVAKCTHIYM